MVTGKPIKIELTHTTKIVEAPAVPDDKIYQKELDETEMPYNMDNVISSMQDLLGVSMTDE